MGSGKSISSLTFHLWGQERSLYQRSSMNEDFRCCHLLTLKTHTDVCRTAKPGSHPGTRILTARCGRRPDEFGVQGCPEAIGGYLLPSPNRNASPPSIQFPPKEEVYHMMRRVRPRHTRRNPLYSGSKKGTSYHPP